MPGLNFDITGDNSNFLRKLEETRNGIRATSRQIEESGASVEQMFGRMAKGAAALGLGFSATQLVNDIVRVRGEFQQLEIAFETMLKSKDKASALMGQLTETAAKTPFDLQSVAQGAKQLLAYGTASEEVNDTLVRLGNIASGLSIPLGDLVYLYGTTQTQGRLFTQDVRQFMGRGIPLVKELAKEMGKTEQQINEMVTDGKIGFPQVEKVIRNMTDSNGQFYNLMEKQSASLTGQISNLGDAWDGMLNKIGTQTQGIASAGISAATSLIENYEEVGVVLASLALSYGTYKAAIIVVNTLEKANIMIMRQAIIEKKLAAAANITLSNSMAIAAARGKMFALVQKNIVSSFKGIGKTLANPYVLLGAAVGAATYGLYKFYTRETEVEQMQRRYNETKESAIKREEEHRTKIDELINSIEDETIAEINRVGAMETLKILYPSIIEKYIDEEGYLRNIIALKKELAEFDATKKVEQNKTELQSYDERIKNQEEYIDRMRTNDQSAFDDEVAKLNELKRQREVARTNVSADYISQSIKAANSMSNEEITNTINAYQKALSENKNGEWFDSGQEFKVEDINRYISALKNLQTARANAIHNKEYWESQKKEAETALDAIDSKQRKLLNAGQFDKVDSKVVANFKKQQKLLKQAESELKAYPTSSDSNKQDSADDKLRKEQEEYATLMNKQALEQKRSAEDLQTQTDQARINAMREGNARTIAQMKFNHQKEMRQLERQQEDVLRKKLENTKSAFEANPSNKGKSFSKVYEEAVNTQKTGDEMVSLFGGGNVDLLARPMIDAAKLVEKGWKDAGDGIATVFSSAYEVEQDGKNVSIQVTPILPDGTVMSQNELESYIDIQLNGAKDVLEADNKGIVIHVDTDVSPEKAEAFGQKLHEYQEKYYDGVSGLSKKGLNLGDFSLSKSQKDSYSQQKGYLNIQHENETKEYYDNILKEYQDYTDKRLAIEKKYNDDIAVLDEQRKIAVQNGDTKQIEQIDRAKAQATKNKGMELMNLDYDKLKESPEYVRAFENLKETSSETLNSLLNQLENAKSAAAKVLSPDQLREYTSTIQSIMDELDSRNPFQSLSDKKKELAEAEEELANAQRELENAKQTAEAVKGGAKIENGVKSSKFNEKTGKIESTKAYLSEAQALDEVKKKTENYNAAKDKVVKKDNQVKKSEKEVRAQISELADTIDELGKSIGGPAGEIISLIGSIGSFTMTAMAGVEAAADTSANAISTVEKASVILAIIGAAVQIAMKIFDMFSKDDTTEKYEKAKETYESYINILDRVIEKQLELAETLTGDTANAVYEAAIANIKTQSENAKVLGKQYLNSGASGNSHSKGYDEVDDMSGEGWKQAAKVLGMSVNEFKNKMGGRMTGLFDLTDEQLLKLQSDAGIFWSQLDSDTQKFADQIANGVGKIAEVLEQEIVDTTLIDYASLRSDFQDLLTDMDADSADFADNFEDYMRNAILNSMLKDEYMDQLTAWREKFYNAMKNGVSEDEYDDLKEEGKRISDEMMAKRKELADIYGWNNDEEREASPKGVATASQDSVDENNGRLTVIQGHTYALNESVKTIQSDTSKIAEKLSYLVNMDKNMSDMVRGYDVIVAHLSNIEGYTANLVEMRQFMYSIKLGIETLNTKGITLKR